MKRKILCLLFCFVISLGIIGCEDEDNGTASQEKRTESNESNADKEENNDEDVIIDYEMKENNNQGIFQFVPED